MVLISSLKLSIVEVILLEDNLFQESLSKYLLIESEANVFTPAMITTAKISYNNTPQHIIYIVVSFC